jgi:copper(I)-binding protein
MTTTADSTGTVPSAGAPPRSALSLVARDLIRAGAAPLACGLVLVAVLAGWVAAGGGGTLSQVRMRVTQAAVPMLSFTSHAAARRTAPMYLTLHNLSGNGDVLLSASSPDAVRVELTTGRGRLSRRLLSGLAVGAGATVSMSPFGPDLVLIDPRQLIAGQDVLLRLRFRNAGVITVEASVTPPGTP